MEGGLIIEIETRERANRIIISTDWSLLIESANEIDSKSRWAKGSNCRTSTSWKLEILEERPKWQKTWSQTEQCRSNERCYDEQEAWFQEIGKLKAK